MRTNAFFLLCLMTGASAFQVTCPIHISHAPSSLQCRHRASPSRNSPFHLRVHRGLKGGHEKFRVNSQKSNNDGPSIAEKRKNRLVLGNRISSALFASVASSIIYMGRRGPLALPLYAASGPLLAAGVAAILAGAASAGRLGSDTYKRLNLFLAEFSVTCLPTIALAYGGTTAREQVFYALSLASFLSLSPALAGYAYGERGLDAEGHASMAPFLKEGAKSTLKGLTTVKTVNGAIYLFATFFVSTLKFLKLAEVIRLMSAGEGIKTIATRAVRLARLILLTGVTYTLKDAADRDRLEGSTFIELNFLSSVAFGAMSYYMKTIRGGVTPLVGTAAFFSVFTGFNGLFSVLKKSI